MVVEGQTAHHESPSRHEQKQSEQEELEGNAHVDNGVQQTGKGVDAPDESRQVACGSSLHRFFRRASGLTGTACPLLQIEQELALLVLVLQIDDVMPAELEAVILAERFAVNPHEDDSLHLALRIFHLLARPFRGIGVPGVHKQKGLSLVDSLDDNIDELLVAFYSSQVYPARAPACDPLYFVLQPEDNVLVTP